MIVENGYDPILIFGASGFLGTYLRILAEVEGVSYMCMATDTLLKDLADQGEYLDYALNAQATFASNCRIINAAALSSAAACKANPDLARALNTELPAKFTRHVKQRIPHARIVHLSTDCVFDGTKAPYAPEANPTPSSVYGRSKALGEEAFLEAGGDLIVRLSLLVGPSLGEKKGFFDQSIAQLQEGSPIYPFIDEWRSAMLYADAAKALVHLTFNEDATGILHLGGSERLSRYDIARRITEAMRMTPDLLHGKMRDEESGDEPRPEDLTLDSSRTLPFLPEDLQTRDCSIVRAFALAKQLAEVKIK